jgi:hypothetical protein
MDLMIHEVLLECHLIGAGDPIHRVNEINIRLDLAFRRDHPPYSYISVRFNACWFSGCEVILSDGFVDVGFTMMLAARFAFKTALDCSGDFHPFGWVHLRGSIIGRLL